MTAVHDIIQHDQPRHDRAWPVAFALLMSLAIVLAVARSGLWPPRLSSSAMSGITPQ